MNSTVGRSAYLRSIGNRGEQDMVTGINTFASTSRSIES